MFNRAVNDWGTKWVPAILEYSYTLSGKKATTVLSLQKIYEGMQSCLTWRCCTGLK